MWLYGNPHILRKKRKSVSTMLSEQVIRDPISGFASPKRRMKIMETSLEGKARATRACTCMRVVKMEEKPQDKKETQQITRNSRPNVPGQYAFVPCLPLPIKKRQRSHGLTDANAQSKCMMRGHLLVVKVTVPGQDVALELFLVRVPELGGLGVQRACAVGLLATAAPYSNLFGGSYLLGSPRRLCKLSRTLCTL